MPNFINDGTQLPFPKVDVFTGGASPRYASSADWNALCQALLDTRAALYDATRFFRPIISSGGAAGDAIVFDTQAMAPGGAPTYRTLVASGYTADQTPIVGVLYENVIAGQQARVIYVGLLPPSVTGLGTTPGEATIDLTTGRLRLKSAGDPTHGYVDKNGNCHLLIAAFIP